MQNAAAGKKEAEKKAEGSSQGLGVGFRIGVELVAGVLVGAAIGWFIDSKLNTKPIFMLAMIAVGFAASVLSVIRILKNLDEAVGLGRAIREKEARDNETQDK
jgi:ATP synthase protein I